MSKALAGTLTVVLLVIAALHLYWGLGGFWPGHDEASLVDMVIGMPAGTPVPPLWACMIVVVCLIIPAGAALILSGLLPNFFPRWLKWAPPTALLMSAIVFLARGASTYISPLVASAQGTAFYELDRMIYAPLCLALGLGLIGCVALKRRGARA
jgi:Protein of unknown function (DUF3995)